MHGFFTSYFYSFFLDCFQKMAKIISVDWRRSQNNKPERGHHANCIWGRDKSALNLICPSEKGKFLCLSIAVVVGANFSECWQLGGAEQGSGPATVLTSTQEEPRTLAVESSAPKSWWGRWGDVISMYLTFYACVYLDIYIVSMYCPAHSPAARPPLYMITMESLRPWDGAAAENIPQLYYKQFMR